MSERYGYCPLCEGHGSITFNHEKFECGRCLGTGFDGSAEAYIKKQTDSDWEKDKPRMRAIKSNV